MIKKTLTIAAILLGTSILANSSALRMDTLQATAIESQGPQMQLLAFGGEITTLIDGYSCVIQVGEDFIYLDFNSRFPGDLGDVIVGTAFAEGSIKFENKLMRHLRVEDWK